MTRTVVDLSLSRLVTRRVVPTGNWLLDAAGGPASPESVTVEPAQTTSPVASVASAAPSALSSPVPVSVPVPGEPPVSACPFPAAASPLPLPLPAVPAPASPPALPGSQPDATCLRRISSMTATLLAIRASDCASGAAR